VRATFLPHRAAPATKTWLTANQKSEFEFTMIIAKIETFPLRIAFKPGTQAAGRPGGTKGLVFAGSLLVKVTTDQGLEVG
jgi:hypothetical protein